MILDKNLAHINKVRRLKSQTECRVVTKQTTGIIKKEKIWDEQVNIQAIGEKNYMQRALIQTKVIRENEIGSSQPQDGKKGGVSGMGDAIDRYTQIYN